MGTADSHAPYEARFRSRVNENGPIPEHRPELGPCHEWTGTKDSYGYGYLNIDTRRQKAHRVAFFLTHGRWPEPCGLHRCDNRACVNVAHLFEGTKADNSRDMALKGRGGGGTRGERHGMSKLTAKTALSIRTRAAAGEPKRALARAYGVSKTTVRDVVRRRTWNHVA